MNFKCVLYVETIASCRKIERYEMRHEHGFFFKLQHENFGSVDTWFTLPFIGLSSRRKLAKWLVKTIVNMVQFSFFF